MANFTLPPDTHIGHVHLPVLDLSLAEEFYHNLVGLDVTQRSYPGALFFSAGGYHHHIGTNTCAGRGAPPPPENVVGLRSYSIQISNPQAWESLITRLQEGGIKLEELQAYNGTLSALVHDPFHIGLEITVNRSLISSDTLARFRGSNS
jgi:catechol 2,3-dioxygenase